VIERVSDAATIEEAAGNGPAASPLAELPRGLSATAWGRWRGKNPPLYLLPENRRGGRCGVCGERLGPVTNLCHGCHAAELEAAR